ncbi:MAG: hypothetical protein ACK5MF_06770 [Vibrio sp.]|uniref:hypothetical protein n=1 Tax=Vibrio sp. TaxID=678 RepID=UPI003A877821
MDMQTIEIMGYAASIMVAISLTMKDIVKLRVLNFIGCALFASYGLIIGALPVVAANTFIAVVNVYYLVAMYREKKATEAEGIQNLA